MEYTEQQKEAIEAVDGNIQVVATAGAGKSSTITGRVKHMIELGIPQNEILIITFSNASSKDLNSKLSKEKITDVTIGTFHVVCKMILEGMGYDNLLDFPNTYSVQREMEQKSGEKNLNISDIMSWIDYQKAYRHNPSDDNFEPCESLYDTSQLKNFFKYYQDYEVKTNTCDFTDWMLVTLQLYENDTEKKLRRWKYVILDEAQDNTQVQYDLMKNWNNGENMYITGDLSQSVYEFRAAVPKLFEDFSLTHNNTKIIYMNTNFRSCRNIVELANNFIRPYSEENITYKDAVSNNPENGILEKHMFQTIKAEGESVASNIQKLINSGIKEEEIAVIYRNNASVDYVENQLKKRKIPYTISNSHSFFEKKEIKGIISILRLIVNVDDDEAFEDLFKVRFYPVTYFSNAFLAELKTEAEKGEMSLYDALRKHKWNKTWQKTNADTLITNIAKLKNQIDKHLSLDKVIDNIVIMFKIKSFISEKYESSVIPDKIESINNLKSMAEGNTIEYFIDFCLSDNQQIKNVTNGVTLTTIHKSKGLEYKVVFLIGLQEGKFPNSKANILSEARLMYVALTRAKEQLYISSVGNSLFYKELDVKLANNPIIEDKENECDNKSKTEETE